MPSSLDKLRDFARGGPGFEVLVVDDGSTDRTVAIVEETMAKWSATTDLRLRVVRNPGNRGKGFSVRHGMLQAQGEWLLFTDADLSTPIEDVATLLTKAAEGYDFVLGSRALRRDWVGVHQSVFREKAGQFFNLVMRLSTGLPFHDTQCGFKLVRRSAAKEIFSRQRIEGFGFDVEVLYIAARLGYKAAEVPIHWNNVEGSKVGTFSGAAAFADLVRVRWWDLMGKYK